MTVFSVNDGDFPNKLTSKLLERREERDAMGGGVGGGG